MPDHKFEKIEIDGWHFRVRYPTQNISKARPMLLIHGYQGNENVMWILTKPIHNNFLMIAPRAPIEVSDNQYIWHEIAPQWPDISIYQDLTLQLLARTDKLLVSFGINLKTYDVMGFSQGAVMAYSLAFLQPERINRVAAIAGFIPYSWQTQLNFKNVKNKSFFIAHGTQDEIIPIKKAHQAAGWLLENGSNVTFCEAEIGHKISANC